MHNRQCPKCQRDGHHLSASSENAVVDYYRCETCGHVWAVDKNRPDARRQDITVTTRRAS